jgi:hypothetical protein
MPKKKTKTKPATTSAPAESARVCPVHGPAESHGGCNAPLCDFYKRKR